ncbi:MAG TPA: type II toxin-antitoxin system HigB family toxin [Gallionella sp.]|nr:type II toxin-antitoxin system HigB family toxin [Gallionella sp.]
MRVIAISTLREFWEKHPQAETPLRSWYADACYADWKTPSDIKAAHRKASFVGNNRIVFNIKGNDYRLIVAVHYNRGMLYIRFVGTHAEYNAINAGKV